MNKKIRLFYGETIDEFGMPIDCLRYYFELSKLGKRLSAEETVVVADVASLMNHSAMQKQERIKTSLRRHIELLKKIISVYGLPIRIRLMSEIFETDDYKKMREKVSSVDILTIESFLSKTVPVNKLAEERKKGFQYALDAIATGLLFDIKIGPPRERYYDEVGDKIIPGKLKRIYLSPTQPLGQNFSFFLTHPEIEKYGVTPYKAGSNKLQDFRIILGETPLARAKELIATSFESINPKTVHPVRDIFEITETAKQFLTGEQRDKAPARIDQLHEVTMRQVQRYIYQPLRLGEYE